MDRELSIPGAIGSGVTHPLHLPNPTARNGIEAYLNKRRARFAERIGMDARSQKVKLDLDIAAERKSELQTQKELLTNNLTFGSGGAMSDQNQAAVATAA